MTNNPTANQPRGRAVGALFFTAFGSLWLLLALYAREQLTAETAFLVATGALVLVFAALTVIREAKRWPRVAADAAMGRAFGWINAIQWIAVAAAVFTLSRLHLDAYVMNAITAIVGLHMFPLARLFRYQWHYVTGALLVAWSVASIGLAPEDHLQGFTSLGTGVILWLSAAVTLVLALRLALRTQEPQAV